MKLFTKQISSCRECPNHSHRPDYAVSYHVVCIGLGGARLDEYPDIPASCPLRDSPEFLYVRAEVLPADPDRVMLLNSLVEHAGGRPTADVVPHTDPGGISFKHVQLAAADKDDAYLRGYDMLPAPKKGAVINDYVVCL